MAIAKPSRDGDGNHRALAGFLSASTDPLDGLTPNPSPVRKGERGAVRGCFSSGLENGFTRGS